MYVKIFFEIFSDFYHTFQQVATIYKEFFFKKSIAKCG